MTKTEEDALFANVTGLRDIDIPEIKGTITCRTELSVGEKRDIFRRAFKGQTELGNGETRTEYDMLELTFGQVCAYLVEWSLKRDISSDALKRDAIKALKSDVYAAIEAAVQKHIKSLEPEKNESAAATKSESKPGKSESKLGAATTSTSAAG
jgi:hypothetical protein